MIKPYDCKNTFNSIYLALGAAFVVTWYEVIVCFSVVGTAFLDVVYISRSVQVAPKMVKDDLNGERCQSCQCCIGTKNH